MKAVILVGGKGTRLGLLDIPKPMVPLACKPLLEYHIEFLRDNGIIDIILLTGHLSEKIESHFGNGQKWGVNIEYILEPSPLGTAGAVKLLEGKIDGRFLLVYGDLMFDFDIERFLEYDKVHQRETIATIICHPNNHPYDSDLVDVDDKMFVNAFLSKPHPENIQYNNIVNAAIYILDSRIFEYIQKDVSCDFGKDIFPNIISKNIDKIKVYITPEYIKDLGTPNRLNQVEKDLLGGKISKLNKKNRRSAIFLDRDGVINEEVNNLCDIEDFVVLPKVYDALKLINDSEYLTIIITNQPVLAKGWLTSEQLSAIHKKMETLMGENKVYIDKLYYCPHHPDSGFDGEIKNLKIECDCRKPNIGMIQKAKEEFNIDLSTSFFIGDTTTDIQTGINAGVSTILLKTGYAGKDNKYNCNPDFIFDDLYEAVSFITNKKHDN